MLTTVVSFASAQVKTNKARIYTHALTRPPLTQPSTAVYNYQPSELRVEGEGGRHRDRQAEGENRREREGGRERQFE